MPPIWIDQNYSNELRAFQMNPILILPTNIVLAVLTALSELILIPFARWTSQRLEGVLVHVDLMKGHLIEVRRRELGPFYLPVGPNTPIKVFCTLVLSGGIIIAIAFAEYGFEQVTHVRDVTRNIDTIFVSTGGIVMQNGIVNSSFPSHIRALRKCVEVGRLRCQKEHGERTCIRSIYYQAFIEKGNLMCADKSTSLLRNTSDVDVVFYDDLNATVSALGERIRLRPSFPYPKARRAQMRLEGHLFEGFEITNGVIFWNESAIFLSMNYVLSTDIGAELPVHLGVFPNSGKTAAFYSDAGALLLAVAYLRQSPHAISGSLVDVHLASTEAVQRRSDFIDSEFVQATTVRRSSIITTVAMVTLLGTLWALSIGKKSHIGTFNGLSRQYNEELDYKGRSENPQNHVNVGLSRHGLGTRIGQIKIVNESVRT